MKSLIGSFMVMFVLLLTACGGGGGGDGSSSMSYDGLTSQAYIDDADTAADLSETAYFGTEVDEMVPISSLQGSAQTSASTTPVIQDLTQLIITLPRTADDSAVAANVYAASIDVEQATEDCGVTPEDGSVTYSVSITETTMNMSATFNSCNQGEGYIANGTITMVMDEELSSVIVNLDYFSMEYIDRQEKITIDGNVTASEDEYGDLASLTMNLILRDDITGEMAKLDNYRVVVTDMGSYEEMTVSGTVFSSENGYVVVTTVEPILLDLSGEPYDGIYQIEGAEGCWAQVDFETRQGSFETADGVTGTFTLPDRD